MHLQLKQTKFSLNSFFLLLSCCLKGIPFPFGQSLFRFKKIIDFAKRLSLLPIHPTKTNNKTSPDIYQLQFIISLFSNFSSIFLIFSHYKYIIYYFHKLILSIKKCTPLLYSLNNQKLYPNILY